MDELTQEILNASRECERTWAEYEDAEADLTAARIRVSEAKGAHLRAVEIADAAKAKIPSREEWERELAAQGITFTTSGF